MKKKTNTLALLGTLFLITAMASYLFISYALAYAMAIAGAILFIVGVVQELEK